MTRPMLNTIAPGQFDFGLNDTQEARAAKLHRESIILDMVSQHAAGDIFAHYSPELQADFQEKMVEAGTSAWAEAIYWPYEMSLLGKSHLLRDWYQQAGLSCGAYDIDRLVKGPDPLSSDWDEKIRRYAKLPWLRFVTSASQIRQAKSQGLVAFYANFQSLVPVARDIKAFDVAYGKGLRSFMPCYNRMDLIGVGCTERMDAGLSMFGVEVVKRCNELGIIVDVSHCGHLTTMDVCRHSRRPVTANHTAARSVFSHVRCKSNEALRAIADTGGVIAVVAVPFFLSGEAIPTIEHMLDHMEYIAELVGWQHVAIGTDWPMQGTEAVLKATFAAGSNRKNGFREQDRVDVTRRLVGYSDCRDLPNITRGLIKRGYSDEQVRGITGENALRVFEAVCG